MSKLTSYLTNCKYTFVSNYINRIQSVFNLRLDVSFLPFFSFLFLLFFLFTILQEADIAIKSGRQRSKGRKKSKRERRRTKATQRVVMSLKNPRVALTLVTLRDYG